MEKKRRGPKVLMAYECELYNPLAAMRNPLSKAIDPVAGDGGCDSCLYWQYTSCPFAHGKRRGEDLDSYYQNSFTLEDW